VSAHALLLAAGAGRRFGGGKLLAPWRGRPLATWALEAALRAPVVGVTVVVAPGGEELQAVLRAAHAAVADAPPLRVVTAEDAAEGMGASLRAGVGAIPPGVAILLFLADMPAVPPGLAGELLRTLEAGALAAAPVCEDRRGHPVALAGSLRPALLALGGDSGAREVLRSLNDRLRLVDTPDRGVLFDVDTPQDLLSGA
jgi:molybdenum cofactor cytidylyltransferase